MLTWIDRTETNCPTGIGRYNKALLDRLLEGFVNVEHSKKMEVEVFGKKLGGFVSRIAWNAFGSFEGVVHAPGIFQLHRDCDTCMIHDFQLIENPEKLSIPGWLWNWHLETIRELDAVLCPSGKTAREVIQRGWACPSNVYVVHHGIDTCQFYPENPSKIELNNYVLLVGRYQKRKSWHQLAGFENFSVPVIRVGPPNKGASKELQDIVESRGGEFRDYGYVSDETLRQLLTGASMVLHPAKMEGFGFVPLEAAACGTPTMCRSLDIYRETVKDLRIPWTVSFDEALEIAENIGSKYLIREASRFSWAESVKKHIKIWRIIQNEDGS